MSLIWVLLLPFLGSICAALLPSNARNIEAWLAGAVSVASVILVAMLYPQVADSGVVHASFPWVPQLGPDLHLRMDGYAWMFALLITGIGALVVFHARYYLSPADPVAGAAAVGR